MIPLLCSVACDVDPGSSRASIANMDSLRCRCAQLDAADYLITLPVPMNFRMLAPVLSLALTIVFAQLAGAAVVFRSGEKAKYVAPGEEEMNGNAAELFQIGQKAEKEGNLRRAIKAYRTLCRKHPKDALAPGAVYQEAVLQERTREFMTAVVTYRSLVQSYPNTPHFNDAIEAQFRIGEMYLAGKKLKLLGIPYATSMDRAVEIFAAVIRTAPYGKYTARAQFDIGLAREKQGANDAALQAYQAVIDKFPSDPIAADAQYQIGYIWFTATKGGTKDVSATNNSRTAFQDFLFRFPNSEKAAQARANLQILEHKTTNSAFDVARFYDKQKIYRAAVIYYNEVIRQQPGSAESEKAKKRIDQLRAKLGDKALQSALDAAEAEKKQDAEQQAKKGQPKTPGSTTAPPLPPDVGNALPPPPSDVDSLTNPVPPTSSGLGSAPEQSATPEESPTPEPAAPSPAEENPEATASPTP